MMFLFCKPVSSKKRFEPFRKLDKDCSFTLFEKAQSVPEEEWKQVVSGKNIFLELSYLHLIESCGNSSLKPRYLIVYKKKVPCAVFYFQVVDFKAGVFGDLLIGEQTKAISGHVKLLENYVSSNKDETVLRLFACGNNLISGQHGFQFTEKIEKKMQTELLLCVTDIISKEEKLRGTISSVLIKDFKEKLSEHQLTIEQKYQCFSVEPNMVVELKPGLQSLEDYIALFSKKYRNRAKSILKAGISLEKRELDLKETEKYSNVLYHLYTEVFEKAKFKLLKLPEDYFLQVKKLFPDQFKITGFFKGEEMIAFTSYFLLSDSQMEAHYIGFNYEMNKEYELYQNILYENIKIGIQNKSRLINLGRTAAEIKTTVGAVAEELYCYAKPQNTISRMLMRPLISFLKPGEWTPRNPFKEEVVGNEKL